MAEDDGFFSRWSRRKVLAKTGDALPEPVAVVTPPVVAPPAPVSLERSAPATAAAPEVKPVEAPSPSPPPTLDDVARLTPESDFKPFVARAVDPQVRNAAMKTLFSDPHFNVMDGLDIYIDDYSKPDPLPLELARKLTSAQFMKVFDAPEEAPHAAVQHQVAHTDTPMSAVETHAPSVPEPLDAPAETSPTAVPPPTEPTA